MEKQKLIKQITVFFVCVSFFFLGVFWQPVFVSFPLNKLSTKNNISDYKQCNNLSFEDTCYCLRNYISTFYNYTLRDTLIVDLEDVKKNGGDCSEYSKIWKLMLEELGFHARVDTIYQGFEGHAYTIAWDNNFTGYCKLDQIDVNCFKFAEDNETKLEIKLEDKNEEA